MAENAMNKFLLFSLSMFGIIPAMLQFSNRKSITTIDEYVNGNRSFSFNHVFFSLLATQISISWISYATDKFYTDGINFIIPCVVGVFIWPMIFSALLPRLDVFFTHNTLTQAIKEIVGIPTMLIAFIVLVVSAILFCIAQLKGVFEIMNNFNNSFKIIVCVIMCLSIAIYVALWGTVGVVVSDVWQLLLACTLCCVCFIFVFNGNVHGNTIHWLQNISFKQILNEIKINNKFHFSSYQFNIKNMWLFLLFAIPAFNSGYTSRVFLSKNVKQAQRAFRGFAWVSLLIHFIIFSLVISMSAAYSNGISGSALQNLVNSIAVFDVALQIVFWIALLLFAMTTIDTFVHAVTVMSGDILKLVSNDQRNLRTIFLVCPFILMGIIFYYGVLVSNTNTWQFFNYAMGCVMPVVAPIIIYYALTQNKFHGTMQIIPVIGAISGTLPIIFDIQFANAGVLGFAINLIILFIGGMFKINKAINV